MYVIVAGGGKIGANVVRSLLAMGHEVTLIEQARDRFMLLEEEFGHQVLRGDATEIHVLEGAGIGRPPDQVLAVTGDDEDNLVVSLLAKQEFAVPRVIARVNNPKNHWMFNESWCVDVAVTTPHLLTSLVEEAVSVGTLVRLLSFEKGRASLIEVTLASDAKAANCEIVGLDFPRDSTIVAVLREERVIFPRGDTVLLPGDEVLVLVTPDSEADVQAILTGR